MIRVQIHTYSSRQKSSLGASRTHWNCQGRSGLKVNKNFTKNNSKLILFLQCFAVDSKSFCFSQITFPISCLDFDKNTFLSFEKILPFILLNVTVRVQRMGKGDGVGG